MLPADVEMLVLVDVIDMSIELLRKSSLYSTLLKSKTLLVSLTFLIGENSLGLSMHAK